MTAGWPTSSLGDLLEIQNGFAFSSKLFDPAGDVGLIRIRDLKNGRETETRFSGDFDERYLVQAGDLLVGMDGEFGCFRWEGEPALLNQRVCRLQNFSDALMPRYLLYGLNAYLKAIEDVTTFTTVKHLSAKQIRAIEFPLPPVAEQQRIVAILDEAFEGIAIAKANAEKNVENARAVCEGYVESLFREGASRWVQRSLGDVCEFVRGPFGGSLKKAMFVSDGYAVYEQQHAIYGRFQQVRYFVDDEKFAEMKRFELHPGDLIMSCSGTMGRVAIVPEGIRRGIINQALLKLTPRPSLRVAFLKEWMDSAAFQSALQEYSGGAAIQNVASVKVLKEIRIPMPDMDEQDSIVRRIGVFRHETNRLTSNHERKLGELDALKASLLNEAFAGNL